MTILLTGFERFPGVAINPTEALVHHLAQDPRSQQPWQLTTAVLPTVFHDADIRIRDLIATTRPRVVLLLGVAADRRAISLERFALNLDDAAVPDNAGRLAQATPIVPDGPVAYRSTLPLDALYAALHTRGIPVEASNHAGTYVCNHVFYAACHTLEALGHAAACGFVHVPMLSEAPPHERAAPGLPLATLTEAIVTCLDTLAGLQR